MGFSGTPLRRPAGGRSPSPLKPLNSDRPSHETTFDVQVIVMTTLPPLFPAAGPDVRSFSLTSPKGIRGMSLSSQKPGVKKKKNKTGLLNVNKRDNDSDLILGRKWAGCRREEGPHTLSRGPWSVHIRHLGSEQKVSHRSIKPGLSPAPQLWGTLCAPSPSSVNFAGQPPPKPLRLVRLPPPLHPCGARVGGDRVTAVGAPTQGVTGPRTAPSAAPRVRTPRRRKASGKI